MTTLSEIEKNMQLPEDLITNVHVQKKAGLLPLAKQDTNFVKMLAVFSDPKNKRHINITGPVDSQKAFLLAAITQETGKKPVILVADELKARTLQNDLSAFLDGEVLIFRHRELNLTEVDASSHDNELLRIGTLGHLLSGDFSAVIVTASACLIPLPPRSDFEAFSFSFSVGARIALSGIAGQLTRSGYERVQRVESVGEFSLRGDILDIFSPGEDHPFRISFFDEDVDELKTFDAVTQRSLEKRDTIRVLPAREVFFTEEICIEESKKLRSDGQKARTKLLSAGAKKDIADQLEQVHFADADRLAAGTLFSGGDKWSSRLQSNRASILDYVIDFPLFLDEAIQFRKRLDGVQAEFMQRFTSFFEKGLTPACASEALFTGSFFFSSLDKYGSVTALSTLPASGNGLPSGSQFTIIGASSDSFRGHEDRLTREIIERNQAGKKTILMTGTGKRTEKLSLFLSENEAFPLYSESVLNTGFSYPAAELLLVGNQDIFGVERQKRRKKSSGIRIDLFSDLVQGELVVHEQHGVGRYDGIVTLETGGAKRDYLKITYAAEDSLYISVESLDQIQKYVGSEGRTPKLSRLGGQEWNRLKEKARSSIRQLAINLVALYAQRQAQKGYIFSPDTPWQREFEEDFPYSETQDQLEAIADVKKDMESEKIMDRLLCGDVGFGKTEVAFRAIFKCVMDGKQAILMSPTTVLAQQHFENLSLRMSHFPVRVGLLSRFASAAMVKETLAGFRSGAVDVVIGTHRVLSADVQPKELGILVIDEEQRFGVEHKEKIQNLRQNVDVLMLTATPIPRTLHMSLSGIRDISVLEEPPMDRRPVQTYVMEYDEEMIAQACLREISRQGQVFYLFNDTRKIQEKAAALEKLLPGARIVYAHGKMGEKRLEEVIEMFILHEADILVCTTIIESGIDMPNVNTIVVENADRFGLAQLYQIRGRVGRSERQAYAYITYKPDKVLTEIAQKRLTVIRDFTELGSGMKIALKDMEVRGAGNLLGAEQHGQMDAIGYDLYCRMLDEEIRNLKGLPEERPVQETVIEMDSDAYISPDYIEDESQRMDAYRRISVLRSEKEYFDILDELQDRYGDIPSQVTVLADISYIRYMAGKAGFAKVEIKQEGTIFYYAENIKPDMEALSKTLAHPDYKGYILLSALRKPYLHYNLPVSDRGKITGKTRMLLQLLTVGASSHAAIV